jgi:hypothetical protein
MLKCLKIKLASIVAMFEGPKTSFVDRLHVLCQSTIPFDLSKR